MRPAEKRWRQLMEKAVAENDPDRFLQIIVEIDKMLWKKLERLMKSRAEGQDLRGGDEQGDVEGVGLVNDCAELRQPGRRWRLPLHEMNLAEAKCRAHK